MVDREDAKLFMSAAVNNLVSALAVVSAAMAAMMRVEGIDRTGRVLGSELREVMGGMKEETKVHMEQLLAMLAFTVKK